MQLGDTRLPQRFWDKVQVDESGCWEWTACRLPNGYGQFWHSGRLSLAHRVSYQCLVGPIPDGLELDHLCRTRGCVNPSHLEAVTRNENILRGMMSTHARGAELCRKGLHRITPENVYVRPSGVRQCLPCMKAGSRAWEAVNRAERNARRNERRRLTTLAAEPEEPK